MEAQAAWREFLRLQAWDHRLSEDDLLEQARKLISKARFLDPYTVTSLHSAVTELPGGEPVADAMVSYWIDDFKVKNLKHVDPNDPFHRPVHPRIQAEFDSMEATVQSKTTALDAVLHIVKNNGWGARQEVALKSATVAEFESIIKTCDIEDLRIFMRKMLELTMQKNNYETHFGSAMDHFVDACRNIAHDPHSGRLGKLMKSLFASSKLQALLDAADSKKAGAAGLDASKPSTA